MQPRLRGRMAQGYRSILALCGDETLLAWSGLAGVAAALALRGSVYGIAVVAHDLVETLAAAWVAGLLASFYASCRAYLGLREAAAAALTSLLVYSSSAALVSTLLGGGPASPLSAAIDFLALALLSLYEEERRKSGLASYLRSVMREYLVFSVALLVAALAAYVEGMRALAALLVVAAAYPVYIGIGEYARSTGLGWGGLSAREKLAAASLLAFYASMAAALLA